LSNINFLAVYTTAKQIAVESEWEIMTNGNKWRFRGEASYNYWLDRNYGRGNDPTALVQVSDNIDDFEKKDTFNYLPYTSDRLLFSPVVLRKISRNFYVGLQTEIEYLYNAKNLKTYHRFLNADSVKITDLPVEGLRSGLGVQLSLDNRVNVLNPIKGTFLTLGTLHNLKAFGSDYTYHSIRLDAREYLNLLKNHTLALRTVWNFRFSENPIPIRGLSRVGGRDFLRGYFKGTYQDNHLASFEVEYRLPFWREDDTSRLISSLSRRFFFQSLPLSCWRRIAHFI
jgi:outer membrane protein assembly factor BamA